MVREIAGTLLVLVEDLHGQDLRLLEVVQDLDVVGVCVGGVVVFGGLGGGGEE